MSLNNTIDFNTDKEKKIKKDFFSTFKKNPIPENEVLSNLGLFVDSQLMKRFLFINELYEKMMEVHGVIFEFGVRWGQNLALFESLRGIYEPFNNNRKIVGFDTFEGFPTVDDKDGNATIVKKGSYSVTENYEKYLNEILNFHENNNPISHLKKYELIKGDACNTIDDYLKNNPQTIISLVYFDFDIYEPTKKCLEAILPFITKGTVIGFDELNYSVFPGETCALREVLGLDKYKIRHSRYSSNASYIVIE